MKIGKILLAALFGSIMILLASSCELPSIANLDTKYSQPESPPVAPLIEANAVTPSSSVLIGEPRILFVDSWHNANHLFAQKTTLAQTATIQTLSLYVTAPRGKLRLGIYDATGPGGNPGVKKAETAEITPVRGWNTANVTNPTVLSPGGYWLAFLTDNDSLHLRSVGTGDTRFFSYVYGAMPETFITTTITRRNHWSFYASLAPATARSNPPTVVSAASASPNPTNAKTTNVSVLAADDGGESSLTYFWSATGAVAVSFSPNSTNSAKNSLATFTKAGDYVLQVSVTDAEGQNVTSSVSATAKQTLSGVGISPQSETVIEGHAAQFTPCAYDQFGDTMAIQPTFTWTVSGGGTIDATGRFTAGDSSGGPFLVTTTADSFNATATVVVTGSQARIYSTNFPVAENPISEKGNWVNGRVVGIDWGNVATSPGLATGTDSASAYSDPTALLTGTWAANQQVEATVYSVNPTETYYQEVEIRLRSQISAHRNTGYEINFRCLKNSDAYMQIVRWNGAIGDFTYLGSYSGAQYGVTNGDVVKVSMVDTNIKVYINNVLLGTVQDSMFSSGSPGMGFNYGCGSTYGNFGFTTLTASELP